MKITFKSFLLTAFAFGSLQGYSQTAAERQRIVKNYDLKKLEAFRVQFENDYKKSREEALRVAQSKGWPLVINGENGRFSELIGISPQGTPLYYTTMNVGSAITSRANQLQTGGSTGLNLNGQNMIAGIWDHNAPRSTHVDFTGRISTVDGSSETATLHNTHVTGTIIGGGVNNAQAKGIAYQGIAWVNSWSNDLSEMANLAAMGLLVSNHSYGLDSVNNQIPLYYYGAYNNTSRGLDQLLNTAEYYQPVVAAGNDRAANQVVNPTKNGNDLLSNFATSKNAIVVAAVNQVNNYTGPSSVVLASFSSWGPTDDNRIKPDISNKGVNVLSATNTSNTSYGQLSGTSMASPGVTGVLLLLQQYYGSVHGGDYMRSATLRGLIAHTADEAGSFDGPDCKFGWGLINALKSVQVLQHAGQSSIVEELTLNQGATYTREVIALGTEPLIATISWTDPAGVANNSVVDLSTPVLVNDLDIRLVKGDEVNMPWKLGDVINSAAEKGDNIVDNIEKVEVPAAAGAYTINITHKGNLSGGSQKYSLIVSGVDAALHVQESEFSAFSVWPNPAKEQLNIKLRSDFNEEVTAVLYDIQGKTVLSQKLELMQGGLNAVLNTGGLQSGIYLLRVSQGALQTVRKVIIK